MEPTAEANASSTRFDSQSQSAAPEVSLSACSLAEAAEAVTDIVAAAVVVAATAGASGLSERRPKWLVASDQSCSRR